MVVFVSWLPVLDDSDFYTTISTQQALEVSGVGLSGKKSEFYKSAIRKKSEIKRLRLLENPNFYTKEELDAIAYFEGTGNYAKYQDRRTKPNVFDSRQSFLLKMHDDQMRDQF